MIMKQILFIKEKEGQQDAISQLKNAIVSRIESAFNITNSAKTESMILPVIPEIKYPKNANVDSYEGLKESYNVPGKKKLETLSWSSIFPVNKNYGFQKAGSRLNGYDYIDFLFERQINQKPFRLISFETRTLSNTVSSAVINYVNSTLNLQSLIKVHFDDLVLVKDFEYSTDASGDIKYTLTLEQFNSDIVIPGINFTQIAVNAGTSIAAKYALKLAGLL